MSQNSRRTIIHPKGGLFQDLSLRIKLILRLLGDTRVSPLLKLLPIGSLVYLIMPDLVTGPIDDAAIIWLGAYLFVELCPPDVVQEHMASLTNLQPGEPQPPPEKEADVVDAEFWEEK